MTEYTATFSTDADYAEKTFFAPSPEKALALALAFHEENGQELMFESYDGGLPVNEIVISGLDGDELAVWHDADQRLRMAAADLLEALQVQTKAAEAVIASWECGDLARAVNGLDHALVGANAVIRQVQGTAKGGRVMTRRHLPPDPERMNERRSRWAALAVRRFQRATGADDSDAVTDLLCDLMHFCDRRKIMFGNELARARWHYIAETEG